MAPGGGGFAASLGGRPGASPFWSDAVIEGRPRVLVIDTASDRAGWEAESCRRIADSLVRRDIPVIGDAPAHAPDPDALPALLDPPGAYNCVFLCGRADNEIPVADYWLTLKSALAGHEKLFALCTWDSADPATADEALTGGDVFVKMAAAQSEPMSGRGASLFFMKFFVELDMHSESTRSMTGKMVWFGHSKAREIMRRRHYEGRVGLRC